MTDAPKNIWESNPPMIARAILLDGEGFSRGQISKKISAEFNVVITRSAVCGVLHRNKPKSADYQKRDYSRRRQQKEEYAPARRFRDTRPIEKHVALRQDPGEPSPGCGLMELNDETCRWPTSDDDATVFAFCGNRPVLGRPYCSHHCHASYVSHREASTERVRNSRLRY